ncbi:unnamed protein product, partial [Choristocarpus tenellus]
MWMVGFVENTHRNQKGLLLHELQDFIRLPGSTVLPGSTSTLDTLCKITGGVSENGGGFDSGSGGADGGGSSAPSAAGSKPTRTSALTDLECMRLRELERRLSLKSLGESSSNVCRRGGLRAYGMANRKLRKILRGGRPPVLRHVVKSLDLETIFQRNREERVSAVRIQQYYKRYYRRKKFLALMSQLRLVVRLQALVRGVLTRRFVAEWYTRRTMMVLGWQTLFRRVLSNVTHTHTITAEHHAATKIQAIYRRKMDSRRASHCRVALAALRIQCLWRGCVDRARVDRLWLDEKAISIQGLARILVAKRVVSHRRRIFCFAARTIQRCFRGRVARDAKNRLIWERELQTRSDFLRVLAAEEAWERENLEVLKRRVGSTQLKERLQEAKQAEVEAHYKVYKTEKNAEELCTQQQMLSPRALQQGWKEELDRNIEQHKSWITQRKLAAVFEASLPARKLEEEVECRDKLFKERCEQADRLSQWREKEMKDIFDREAHHHFDKKNVEEIRKVADEKRKWAVMFVTPSGKPDKLKARRRRCPWEAFAEPTEAVLKEVFSGGSIDLFATDRSRSEIEEGGLRGQTSSLHQTMARIQLQSHINQVVSQFDRVIGPVEEIVNRAALRPLLNKVAPSFFIPMVSDKPCSTVVTATASQVEQTGESPLPLPEPPMLSLSTPSGGMSSSSCDSEKATIDTRATWGGNRHSSNRTFNALAGFVDRYGAAASTPSGPPPSLGCGGSPVPFDWDEKERIRARIRQRRLYNLAQIGDHCYYDTDGSETEQGGAGRGRATGSRGHSKSLTNVPWHLLDELEAEKNKRTVC